MRDKDKIHHIPINLLTIGIILLSAMTSFASNNPKIKQPNVSGQFYTANPKQLASEIDGFFDQNIKFG